MVSSRVLIFANDNSTLYNFRRELLSRLVADGFNVTVALPAHGRNQAFRDLGCTVIETPLSRFGTNPMAELATLARFGRIARRARPDVVLTFTAKPNIYGGIAAQFCRVPYIGAVTGLGAAFQSDDLLKWFSSILYRIAFRRAHAVFFENVDNMMTFRRIGIVGDQAKVVSGAGVNLVLHSSESYPEASGNTRFITVARIRRDKGYDELFEVIQRVCTERDDVEFEIVGWYEDDRYRSVVDSMQVNYPVTFHDDVPQQRVHELMTAAHCLIHPSHHEGMANVILEASATGRPCIVSDIPGCREPIEDSATGLLHAARSAVALYAAVIEFLDIAWVDQREMGLAARRKMENEFDRESVVDQYIAAIRRAVRGAQEGDV